MDMKALMRQAQEMQKKMQRLQEELAQKEFEGAAGGGMVKVIVTGAGLASKITLDPTLVKVDEKEILEDLIIAAFNDAKNKADSESSDSLRAATQGIPLPPGLKL